MHFFKTCIRSFRRSDRIADCFGILIFIEEQGTSLVPSEVVAQIDAAHVEFLPHTTTIPELMAVVTHYNGKLPIAIATGNSRNLIEPLMTRLDLHRYFQAVVFGDEVTHPKPHPECFLRASEAIDVAPEHCEVFEDGDAGIEGARRAGTRLRIFESGWSRAAAYALKDMNRDRYLPVYSSHFLLPASAAQARLQTSQKMHC